MEAAKEELVKVRAEREKAEEEGFAAIDKAVEQRDQLIMDLRKK